MWPFDQISEWLFGKPKPATPAPGPLPVASAPPVNAAPTGNRPRILISGGSGDSKSVAAMVTQIHMAGGEPVVMVDHKEQIERYGSVENAVQNSLQGISGLVVLGNDRDMPPETYGEAAHAKTKSLAVNDDGTPNLAGIARRNVEKLLMQRALDNDIPLLGICAAMQGVNVDGGGTLLQHVPDVVGHNRHAQGDDKIAPFVPVQFVKIEPGSELANIAGSLSGLYTPQHRELPPGVVMENSFHHQAVKTVRPDFRISAMSDDGLIEAIEPKPDGKHPNRFAQFVQFHPEFGASDLGPKLAMGLVDKARAYAKGQGQPLSEVATAPITIPGPIAAQVLARRQQAAMSRAESPQLGF